MCPHKSIPSGRPARLARAKKQQAAFRSRYSTGRRTLVNPRTGGFLGIESKFIDYTFDDTIVTTNTSAEMDPPGAGAQTTPGSISAIAQGDGESNRDGRKCTLTSVHLRGTVTQDASSGTSLNNGGIVRLALVQDTQTNGVQLNSENVFLTATNVELAFRNLQFSKRFKVLMSKLIVFNKTAGAGDGTADDSPAFVVPFTFNKKVNIPVIHNGTTAVVAAITDNSLHIVAFASTAAVNLKYESRVRFVG